MKPFNELTLEEQIKWIEKETKRVVERLPSLKKNLSTYNDISTELYNLEPEEIRVMSKAYQQSLKSGSTQSTSTSLNAYVGQLEKYGETPMETLRATSTEQRIESFLNSVEDNCSVEEYDYVKSMVDNMSDELKEEFVKSKYFWQTNDYPSDGLVKFNELYKGEHESISPATANLETFLKSKGISTDEWYEYEK